MNKDYLYKIFHIDQEIKDRRSELYEQAYIYMSNNFIELDTQTIKISCDEEYKEFLNKTPGFNVFGDGAVGTIDHEGWKYGEIGIWASNYTAWNNFLKTDAKYLILMEDDIVIHPDFKENLENFISQLPEDFDAFSMFSPESHWELYNSHPHNYDIGKENISKAYQDWSMLCFIISRKGAEKAIQSVKEGIFYPIDWNFFKRTEKFEVYTVKPVYRFCWLEQLESTFQAKEYRIKLEGNIQLDMNNFYTR